MSNSLRSSGSRRCGTPRDPVPFFFAGFPQLIRSTSSRDGRQTTRCGAAGLAAAVAAAAASRSPPPPPTADDINYFGLFVIGLCLGLGPRIEPCCFGFLLLAADVILHSKNHGGSQA